MATMEDYLYKVAKKTSQVSRNIAQQQLQRRSQVTDLYGIEYTRQGSTGNPATFYFSVSQDLMYYERFEFKIIIDSFIMPVSEGGKSQTIDIEIGKTALAVKSDKITPDPHTHSASITQSEMEAGVTIYPSTVTDFHILIEGIDITPYLKAVYPEQWINGEGIFPSPGIENYDILKIVPYMPTWQQGVILTAGYKKVQLIGNGVYQVTFVNYPKYNHVNR